MAISFSDNIRAQVNRPLDFKFGPFDNVAQANATIPIAQRYHGLIFGVYTDHLNIATSDIDFFYYWDGLTDSDVKPLSGSKWSDVGSDIYRNSRVLVGGTTFTDSTAEFEVNGNALITGQLYSPANSKSNSGTGTVTFDWNDGNIQTVTLTGNCTFAFSNPESGASYQIIITQDGVGGRTIIWPAGIYWENKTIPTLTGTANSRDIVTMTYDGTNYNALIARNFGT
jgi:hypothetical protein